MRHMHGKHNSRCRKLYLGVTYLNMVHIHLVVACDSAVAQCHLLPDQFKEGWVKYLSLSQNGQLAAPHPHPTLHMPNMHQS